MKRFINIGNQTGNTDEGVKEFCFFDTVTDQFETFQGECCWTSVKEFTKYYDGNELDRYLSLIPELPNPYGDWEEMYQLAKKKCKEYDEQIQDAGGKLSKRGRYDFRRGFERGYMFGVDNKSITIKDRYENDDEREIW